MLKTLGMLPDELKGILREYADMPECVGVVDQFELEGDKAFGCLYVVIKNGHRPSDRRYRELKIRAQTYGESVGWAVWDETPIIRVSTEKAPLIYVDIEDLESGVDYRMLSVDEMRKELE